MKLPALVDVTCKQVTELFADYLSERGMGAADRARFEQHLYACTWCMDYLDQLQEARRASRALAQDQGEVPEGALVAMYRRFATADVPAIAAPAPAPRRPEAPVRSLTGVRFACKFLRAGGIAPISRFAWPLPSTGEPGAWVSSERRVEPCRVGVHACLPRDVSSWLHDTLWLVELAGPLQRSGGGVVAPRGRLICEVEAWREGGAMRFAQAAHDHARELVEAAEPLRREAARPCVQACAAHLPNRSYALAAFCAAMAVARLRGIDHFEKRGYDAERRWQSSWIRREHALDARLADIDPAAIRTL